MNSPRVCSAYLTSTIDRDRQHSEIIAGLPNRMLRSQCQPSQMTRSDDHVQRSASCVQPPRLPEQHS